MKNNHNGKFKPNSLLGYEYFNIPVFLITRDSDTIPYNPNRVIAVINLNL